MSPSGAVRRGSVLVVDDDPFVASILLRILAADHDVRGEGSALAALHILRAEFFDAVVTDVLMPDLTGAALYRGVKAFSAAQAERMVFVTGGTCADEMAEELAATGRPIQYKPFDIQSMRKTIRTVIAGEGLGP